MPEELFHIMFMSQYYFTHCLYNALSKLSYEKKNVLTAIIFLLEGYQRNRKHLL